MPDSSTQNQEDLAKKKETKTDNDGNEIGFIGKCFAGFFLIAFTTIGAIGIIAYWPDRLPAPDEKIAPLYINELFHVRLACVSDTICCADCIDNEKKVADTVKLKELKDSSIVDTLNSPPETDTQKNRLPTGPKQFSTTKRKLLHINTLLLLLVALGGFLGNMIHVATSFTTFVGAGKFKRSWVLWYCIKPFTASALAIGIYFVFRGGFLNMSDGGSSINLYGLMTISIFAGLFTDKATEKLKEIFEVLFRSKEERPNPLIEKFKITGITPLSIEKDKENNITLSGEKLDTEKLIISINEEVILDPVVTTNSIMFAYSIPETQKDKTEFTVSVKDEKGKEHYTTVLRIKDNTAQGIKPGAATDDENDNDDSEPALG